MQNTHFVCHADDMLSDMYFMGKHTLAMQMSVFAVLNVLLVVIFIGYAVIWLLFSHQHTNQTHRSCDI